MLASATCVWCSIAAMGGCSVDAGPSEPAPFEPSRPSSLQVILTPAGRTFVSSQTVELSVENEEASIHFTLDGTTPSPSSPLYESPISLMASARLRAVAMVALEAGDAGAGGDSGALLQRGPMSSATYLRVAADTSTFTSHLPILVFHTFEAVSIDPDSNEFVPTALLVIEPNAGESKLVGPAGLDTRAGIHVRGATSRTFPKKQYAVELWNDMTDEDLAKPLLGMPAESDWVISDPVSFDRSLIRNALAFALSNRIGRYAPRTRFAEVFLTNTTGDVRSADFLGFYTVIEKIKRDSARIAVAQLTANHTTEPDLSGGFILRIDKGTNDFRAGGRDLQFVYPDSAIMTEPARRPQLNFIRRFIDEFGQAANTPNFTHPTTGQHYSEFIDVDAFIDHNIVNALAKNVDALRISTYFHKDRGGRLAAGPIWDFDRSLGTPYDERARDPEEWKRAGTDGTDYFQEGWWGLLFQDPVFKARYRQRFLQLLDGEFSADNLDSLVDSLVTSVGAAASRNFERWGDTPPRDGSHASEVTLLKDFLRRRTTWIRAELNTW